ncbi:MAG: DUF1573 domain-containing protein [Desulfobacter sp.]|nr:MAG: DUF1573 domain-containing protein [Desulfobacter sp.]
MSTETEAPGAMKHIITTILTSLCFLICWTAGLWAAPTHPAENTGGHQGPKLFVKDSSFHGGTLVEGVKLIHDFTLENQGGAPLILTSVTSDCSCTATNADRTILPGKTGRVRAVFNTEGWSGAVVRKIRINTNDPRLPVTLLEVGADILERISVKPGRVFFNGLRDRPMERTVEISTPDRRRIELSLLEARLSDQVGFHLNENRDKTRWEVIFKNKALRPGSERGRVTFKTGLKKQPKLTVPVFSRILDPYQAIPRELSFGKISPAAPKAKRLTIRSHDGTPFKVASVAAEKPVIETETRTLKPGIVILTARPHLVPGASGTVETTLALSLAGKAGNLILKIPVRMKIK